MAPSPLTRLRRAPFGWNVVLDQRITRIKRNLLASRTNHLHGGLEVAIGGEGADQLPGAFLPMRQRPVKMNVLLHSEVLDPGRDRWFIRMGRVSWHWLAGDYEAEKQRNPFWCECHKRPTLLGLVALKIPGSATEYWITDPP